MRNYEPVFDNEKHLFRNGIRGKSFDSLDPKVYVTKINLCRFSLGEILFVLLEDSLTNGGIFMKMQILMSKQLALMFVMVFIGFSLPGISDGAPRVHIIDPDSPPIYWTDYSTDKIQRANLDGTYVEDLLTTGLREPAGIALDVVGGKMYWTDRDMAKIQRANLDGTHVENLIPTGWLRDPIGIALDVVGGKMYWTDLYHDHIRRANLDGTHVEDLVTTGLRGPAGIALDVVGGKMYWTDSGTAKIQRANLDGTNIEDLATYRTARVQAPVDIALDIVGGKMYWTDLHHDHIRRANLDGTHVENLVTTGLRDPAGIALDVAGGKMYWTERGTAKIQRANLDGTDIEDLVSTAWLRDPVGIALDVVGGKMYWTDEDTDKIQRANLDGTRVEDLVPTGLRGPAGIALDVVGGKMYWTDFYTDKIQRANLDGTRVEDLVPTGWLRDPFGIALDVAGGKMYWTDYSTNKIQRANFDGTHIEDLVPTGWLMNPAGIALDVVGGKMYWTDVGTDKIQRANLDGTRVEDLVTTGLRGPASIALDVVGGKMYWTDWDTNKIQRANLDGTNVEDLVTTGLGDPYGIALDVVGGKMYWADRDTGKIRRANLDGTDIQDVVTGLETPRFIALGIPKAVGGSDPQQPDASTEPDITTPSLVEVADLDLSHGGDVRCVAYSPSGVVLASGGTDNTMRLWRTSNGQPMSTYEHGGDVNSIAFTPNGTYIATGSDDGKLRLYKGNATADPWMQVQVFNMPGGPFSNNVKSVAFSHDNTMLACGTSGNKVYVWYYNMVSEKWENRKELSGHTGNVNSVAFSPGGVVLASASADGTVQLWRARTGELLNTLDGHTEDVNSVAFSSDDALIATGSDDDTVILWKWSASDNTWVYDQTLEGHHSGDVRSVAFNPSGTVLLSASADRTIGVWDGRTGDYHASLIEHDAGVINSVTYNFQGNAIAIGTDDGTVRQLIHTELTDITDKGISLTVPLDLISEVAFGTNATYFVFTAQYPILTGVADTDAYYLRCNITLDLPNVREDLSPLEYAVIADVLAYEIPMDSLEEWVVEHVPDRTQYFMFPLKTPQERIREVSYDYKLEIAFQALGFIPILGDVSNVISIGRTVTQTTLELYDILKSTVDPTITLNRVNYEEILQSSVDIVGEVINPINVGTGPVVGAINPINLGIVPVGGAIKTIKELASFFKVGRPDIQQRFIVILPRREEAIDIKMELTFLLRSSTVPIWFTQSYAVEYEGKWNLRDGTLAAPSAQPMSLADYPPFQELPPEVQEYLLQHFGKYVTTRDGRIPEIPETTALLPNYPNPFNPETWIPYQLATSADVTLMIYDINGHVVRDLDFGHQRAGIYQSKSRAAYWDGRNAQGESVASGVYFYTLTAGDFTATRKMLIRK